MILLHLWCGRTMLEISYLNYPGHRRLVLGGVPRPGGMSVRFPHQAIHARLSLSPIIQQGQSPLVQQNTMSHSLPPKSWVGSPSDLVWVRYELSIDVGLVQTLPREQDSLSCALDHSATTPWWHKQYVEHLMLVVVIAGAIRAKRKWCRRLYWQKNDVGLIRTDAPEGTRFLVLRIRPLCHNALLT